MTEKKIITRFAPSPTGYLHIGGARTALYNYLLAKKFGGKFILRIEDTDLERSTDEAIQAILDGMTWLGLNWDEGPYYQTKRFDLYNEAIEKLVAEKKAYPCFCSAESLDEKRKTAQANKIKYKYDRNCYHLSDAERIKKLAAKEKHVIRFFSPDEEKIVIRDVVKGEVIIDAKELDDLIIKRSDGSPTYNFTVVVDDILMGITHVIRGDDHLNNTPRQIQLYQAMNYKLPVFAHLPMILGPDKKKLSKRHGATSVMAYRDMGYLPHALLNYLVRLGWSFKDQEIFTMKEMIENFNLESCSPSAGVFNPEKLDWLNGHYIRASNPKDLAPLVKELFTKEGVDVRDEKLLVNAVTVGLAKVKTLKELAEFIKLFFVDVPADPAVIAKTVTPESKPLLKRLYEELQNAQSVDHDSVHSIFEKIMTEFNVKLGKIAGPARAALSGLAISPGVYELIQLFGKEKSLKKLECCL